MAKNKLKRFAAIKTFDHVIEPEIQEVLTGNYKLKGQWHQEFFINSNPIILELGCGKGEYSVGLARKYPDKNYLGVDIKGSRMFVGAEQAEAEGLNNVGFLRTRIEFIQAFFAENEVDEIWLTFSDPQPNKPKKRLSYKRYIDMYREFLKPGGIVHLKTDSDLLYESTIEEIQEHGYHIIQDTADLYGALIHELDEDTQEILQIKTHYEALFSAKGFKIKYLKFTI
jgi:tRNA (guanine-N7-)-methyltransferase